MVQEGMFWKLVFDTNADKKDKMEVATGELGQSMNGVQERCSREHVY